MADGHLEKALSWLSSVNPAWKLQAFRRDRQEGTGDWLFDLPEMSYWLENKNAALWVWGIPGYVSYSPPLLPFHCFT